jgi:hypothetical protein
MNTDPATGLQAVGLVLQREPFTAITADLAHGCLLLTTAGRTIVVSGNQLRDLLRLGRLAATPTTCWRCYAPFVALGPNCRDQNPTSHCSMQAHCEECNQWLHSDKDTR